MFIYSISLWVSVAVSVTVSLTVYLSLLNFKCQPNPDQYLLVAWTEWLCVFLQSSVALLMKWEQLALSIGCNWLSVICITELDNYHGVPLTQILITTYMKIGWGGGGGGCICVSFMKCPFFTGLSYSVTSVCSSVLRLGMFDDIQFPFPITSHFSG